MSRKHRRNQVKLTAIFAGICTAIVLGGLAAVASEYKSVAVTVDGATRQMQTTNRTVEQVVSDMGIKVGKYDQVSPALDTKLAQSSSKKQKMPRLLGKLPTMMLQYCRQLSG